MIWFKNGPVRITEDPIKDTRTAFQPLISFRSEKGTQPELEVLKAMLDVYRKHLPQVIEIPTFPNIKAHTPDENTFTRTTEYTVVKSVIDVTDELEQEK